MTDTTSEGSEHRLPDPSEGRGPRLAASGRWMALLVVVVALLVLMAAFLYPRGAGPSGSGNGPTGKSIASIIASVAGTGADQVNSSDATFAALPSASATPHNCTFVVVPPSGTDAVEVLVEDANGAPVPGATTMLSIDQGLESFHASPSSSVLTDRGGVAHFTSLQGSIRSGYSAGGILLVNATAPGYDGPGFTFGEIVVDAPPSLSC